MTKIRLFRCSWLVSEIVFSDFGLFILLLLQKVYILCLVVLDRLWFCRYFMKWVW